MTSSSSRFEHETRKRDKPRRKKRRGEKRREEERIREDKRGGKRRAGEEDINKLSSGTPSRLGGAILQGYPYTVAIHVRECIYPRWSVVRDSVNSDRPSALAAPDGAARTETSAVCDAPPAPGRAASLLEARRQG